MADTRGIGQGLEMDTGDEGQDPGMKIEGGGRNQEDMKEEEMIEAMTIGGNGHSRRDDGGRTPGTNILITEATKLGIP